MDDVGNESEQTKKHQNYVKKRNEWCFLKDKQQIKYQSFIILEIIPLEKINQLFNGLEKLYSEVSEYDSSKLDYRRILPNSQSKLFQSFTLYLPPLVNSKFKEKLFPGEAFHNLGDNFQQMDISISHPIPSTTILTINVHLEEGLSKKINDIIYQYHTEKREPIKAQKGNLTRIISPEQQKESEIYNLRKSLHEEAVNFLRKFFIGNFFELITTIPSIVPSIDLFSFDFPSKDDEIVNWGMENSGFLRCFGTFIGPYNCFRYENYLLAFETSDYNAFNNYVLFANRSDSVDETYCDVDTAIKLKINDCNLDLLAIDRFVKQQENRVGKLNLIISQEIENIKGNNFNNAIENRKEVIQTIFAFERFGVEFKEHRFLQSHCKFYELIVKEQSDKQIELFKALQNNIEARIKEIKTLNSLFSHEHETILSLKNLEFNKKMQDVILVLTMLIILLTVIQVLLIIVTEWEIINNLIALIFEKLAGLILQSVG